MRTYEAATPEAMLAIARALGRRLEAGDAVALTGGLGAGKTLFVRGLVEGLGGDPLAVSSPSFALMQRYEGRVPLVHVDLYRLGAAEAAYDLGLEEEEGVVLAVEWAERAPALLPPDRIEVRIDAPPGDGPRRVVLVALGPRATARLAGLAAELRSHSGANRL